MFGLFRKKPQRPPNDVINEITNWMGEYRRCLERLDSHMGEANFIKLKLEASNLMRCVQELEALWPDAKHIWEELKQATYLYDQLIKNGEEMLKSTDVAFSEPSKYQKLITRNQKLGLQSTERLERGLTLLSEWLGINFME